MAGFGCLHSPPCLKKKVEEAKDRIVDLEQYSRRNCLIFTGTKEAGEDETENTDEIILDICQSKLQIELHRFSLDRTHRLGRKRTPRPDTEVPKPRPIIAKFINYHNRDSVYKCTKAQGIRANNHGKPHEMKG